MAAVRKLLEEQRKLTDKLQEAGKNTLGQKPEEMKKEDKDKLNQIAEQQKNLAQQTDKAIVNWKTFDIAPHETTQFVQPGAGSVVNVGRLWSFR